MEIGQHALEGKMVQMSDPFLVLDATAGHLAMNGVVTRKSKLTRACVWMHLTRLDYSGVQDKTQAHRCETYEASVLVSDSLRIKQCFSQCKYGERGARFATRNSLVSQAFH
jgi:hypothetical protein